jgi:hypothetical protein
MKLISLCLLLALSAIWFPGSLYAATLTVGLPAVANNGNCIPFGCPAGVIGTFTEYRQIYASSVFGPSPISISAISFFNTEFSAGSIDPATYAFSLSTSPSPLSGGFVIGPDNTEFFSGVLGGPIAGGKFTVSGTPFSYDPANGNLLLDILISNPTIVSSSTVFLDQSDGTAGTTNRDAGGPGLITEFTFNSTSSVPEPSSAVLSGAAILALLVIRLKCVCS